MDNLALIPRPILLWAGEKPLIDGELFEFKEVRTNLISVHGDVIFVGPASNFNSSDLLQLRRNSPRIKFVLSLEQIKGTDQSANLSTLVDLCPDQILVSGQESEQWKNLLQILMTERKALAWKNQYAEKLRGLEGLTQGLERTIQERTKFLEESNREENLRLQNERQIIRLVQEFGLAFSLEEILLAISRDHKQGGLSINPVLLLIDENGDGEVMTLRSNRMEIRKFQKQDCLLDAQEKIQAGKMANFLSRPVLKGLNFSIGLDSLNALLKVRSKCVFFVEMTSASYSEEELRQFLEPRISAISLAIEKSLLEKALRQFASRWERVFNGLQDPIAVIDSNYNVIRSNQNFSSNKSRTDEKCYRQFAGRDQVCQNCPMERAKSAGSFESSISLHDRLFKAQSFRIGDTATFVHQYLDKTMERRMTAQVFQAEKMGLLAQLSGHIAHELNNPLTGIRSLIQVNLLNSDLNETLRKDLIEIEKASARCQGIIASLQQFTNRDSLPKEQIANVDDTVRSTLAFLKTVTRHHRVLVNLKSEGIQIRMNPGLLQQVVFNLVNNGAQAMKQPGQVSIRTFKENGFVAIEITDTGEGIPREIQSRLFEPFFTTKQAGKGTGLGLTLVKTLVESAKGRIEFVSEFSKGTTFTVFFPIKVKD